MFLEKSFFLVILQHLKKIDNLLSMTASKKYVYLINIFNNFLKFFNIYN